jgi:hypothetical protein
MSSKYGPDPVLPRHGAHQAVLGLRGSFEVEKTEMDTPWLQ